MNQKTQCRQRPRRITLKRPPNPLDRVETPKRTRGDDDDHSALLSAYHHDLERVSHNLNDGTSVFSGTGMPDMSDSAWLAIKITAETQKGEKPLQKDVDNLLVTVIFRWVKKQYNRSAAIPTQRQPSM